MRSKQFLVCLFVVWMVCGCFVLPVRASSEMYNTGAYGSSFWLNVGNNHPSATTENSAVYSVINITTGGFVEEVRVWGYRQSSLITDGKFYCRIYTSYSGTWAGGDIVPSGSYLEESSTNCSASALVVNVGTVMVFSFAGTSLVTSGQLLIVEVFFNGSTTISGREITLTGSAGFEGQGGKYSSSAFAAFAGGNFNLVIYGNTGGVTPAASSSGGAGDGSWLSSFDFSSALSWFAVLLLWLIPTFILGVYMRGGKWGFLIGLAIGTGLSYFVFPAMVPIWLVILVAIGLGAAFLTSVKEGG